MITPPTRRPRSKPRRKGETDQSAYNREAALQEARVKEREANERRAAQIEKTLQPLRRTQESLSEQVKETPFTGQAYQQAAEEQRQEKVQKLEDINKGFEAAFMAQLGTDVAVPLLKAGFNWAKNKAISPAAKTLMNTDNFIFEPPNIKPVRLNTPSLEESLSSKNPEQPVGVNLVEPLFKKPRLALPQGESLPPEATYTGKKPSRILDLNALRQKNEARAVLEDIAQDPNDYTFMEINQALQDAFRNDGTVPIKINSSGEIIHLGNNIQEELKKVNAILDRYGYEKIPEGMDDIATRQAVLDRAAEHRTFGRGVYLKPKGSKQDKALTKQAARNFGVDEKDVTAEMKLQTAATHTVAGSAENGRQGLVDALHKYGLRGKYDAIYTSNRDQVMAGYSNPGYGHGSKGKAYLVQMPVNDTPNTSLTQLWENNEFPIMDDMTGDLTYWRTHELPYMLKTGNALSVDVEREAGSIDPDWIRAAMEVGEKKKQLLPPPIKYSDTKPTEKFIQGVYTKDGLYGSKTPYQIESDITYAIQKMMQYGVKPINPVRSYKLGPRRFEIGDVEVMDPSYTDPVIEEMTLKYPWALERLNDNLRSIQRTRDFLSGDVPVLEGMSADWRDLSVLRRFGGITNKQYNAVKTAYRFGGDPLKYIDFKKAVQAAKNQYFKDIRLSHSRDAWHRKLQVANDEKNYQLQQEYIDRATGQEIANLMFKSPTEIASDIQKELRVAGVKPNTSLKSKDGYRVFTTEGVRNPDPNDKMGQHFVVVGPKDTKMLNVVGEYTPQSSRRHHSHIGDRVSGLSRNLGQILSPLFLGGAAAYDYYTNDKK